MNVDRFMAIKQSYRYDEIVTKARVLTASVVVWIFTSVVLIFHFVDNDLFLFIQNLFAVAFMAFIFIRSVVVYREAGRHEKQIAAQQVSAEVFKGKTSSKTNHYYYCSSVFKLSAYNKLQNDHKRS